jgi:outer membrane protein assembly factor BamA
MDKRFSAGRKVSFLAAIFLLALSWSCGPARHLKEDQRLLTKVKIKNTSGKQYNEDLMSVVKQRPNRKLLGLFKIYLGVYNLYYDKEDSKIKEKIGEPPVIYDSTTNETSEKMMIKYLQNMGYYDTEVSWEHKVKKKRANVVYKVDKGERYQISSLSYQIENPNIRSVFFQDTASSHVKRGKYFDLDLMAKERQLIEKQMKNVGYYRFSREFVVFEADTSRSKKEAKLTLTIKNKVDKYKDTDSLTESRHQIYSISKVYVRMNYSAQRIQNRSGDTTMIDSLTFIDLGSYELKKRFLCQIINIRPGDRYQVSAQEQSYANLSALGIFSYVSIHYEENYNKKGNKLDVYIDLNPSKQKSYSVQTEGTNNGGNLGVNANLSFQNKNTFNAAELLEIRFNGGLEAQQILTEEESTDLGNNFLPFNTFEFGPEASIEIPRFLLPIKMSRYSFKGNPTTTFNASYNYQERPDYIRNVSKVYMAYSWNETPQKTHIVQPIDLSYIKLTPSPRFEEVLAQINNPFLRNSYTDNLILALKYSFIWNNKTNNNKKNHFFFRFNAESAGNLLSALTENSTLSQNEDGSYNIAGIRFAQYARSDFDFRYYQNYDYNQLVYRFAAGLGIPYGNSKAMPFEKSFYAGGANGIRAWRARELGPGSLPDSSESNVDQIGNMSLEGNIELRFPITGIFEGAAFIDAGNIWNVSQEDSRPNTEFAFQNLWKGTAVGVGAGLRLNFTFFVMRLDIATPIKDPGSLDPYLIKSRWNRTNLNLGIGYPF